MHRFHIVMNILITAAAGLTVYAAALPAWAQPGTAIYPGREAELDNEAAAREKCLANTSTPSEAADCTQWIALSTCAMNYDEGMPQIEKFLSEESFQKYRIAARRQLPAYCDPMAAVKLDLEILDKDSDFDESARRKRWLSIIGSAPKLTPEQHLIAAREAAQSPDFAALVKDKKAIAFFRQTRDEISEFLPEISPDASIFLRELEAADGALIDARAHAVMMIDEIAKKQYASAWGRFKYVDFGVLSDRASKKLIDSIFQAALPLFGTRSFADSVCFPEFPAGSISKMEQSRFDALRNPASEAAMTVLRYEASVRFSHCDFDGVLGQFADIWNIRFRQTDSRDFAEELVDYIEQSSDGGLFQSAVRIFSSRLKGDARSAFAREYGARLGQIALITASAALEQPAMRDSALEMLDRAMTLVPQAQTDRMLLLHGRIDAAQKKYAPARRYWSRLIENKAAASSVRARAYYLSIRSLQRESKNKEADALFRQFKELMPAHPLHAEF